MKKAYENTEALDALPDDIWRALESFIRMSSAGSAHETVYERLTDSVVLKLHNQRREAL